MNRTVVLNVEGLDVEIAQRIIDFTSGSCFAISGNLRKISNYIFIMTPSTVDISGDFQDIMDSFDLPGDADDRLQVRNMTEEEQLLQKRFLDLSRQADYRRESFCFRISLV